MFTAHSSSFTLQGRCLAAAHFSSRAVKSHPVAKRPPDRRNRAVRNTLYDPFPVGALFLDPEFGLFTFERIIVRNPAKSCQRNKQNAGVDLRSVAKELTSLSAVENSERNGEAPNSEFQL